MEAARVALPATSLLSRRVVWVALLLALAVAALGGAFVAFEFREIRDNQLERAELYARTLDDQTATVVAATEGVLRALQGVAEPSAASGDMAALAVLLEDSLRGRPFLRSVSWVDAQGGVLASSNPTNRGMTVAPAWLGVPALPGRGARLGALAAGRDIDELGQGSLEASRAQVLPMALPVDGGHLLALINPDHLATQFDRTLDGQPLRALLIGLDGQLLAASSEVAAAPGASMRALAAFTRHLPAREFASGEASGSDGQRVLSAFRVTRQWPLVVVVEQPYPVLLGEVAKVAQWAVAFVLTAWLLLGLGAWAARRTLQRDESLNRDLALAHEARRDSETRARATFEQAAVGVMQQGFDRRFLRVNQALCDLLGYTPDEFLALDADRLIHPDDKAEGLSGMRRLLASEIASFAQEKRYRHKDGHSVWVRLTASIARGGQGDPLYMIGIIEDIGARRRAEAELAAARQRELQVGARIQQSLLVTAPPNNLDGVHFSCYSQASQGIDGDFVEIIRVGPHCVDLVAGDVMGKGLAAAMMGAATKLQFSRSMAELLFQRGADQALPEPADVVAAVHRAMTPALQQLEAFVTLCYMRIDTTAGRVTWVGCGHEETLLVPAAGAVALLDNQHPPLGVLDAADYRQDSCALAPGDALFLCSDGVTDALRPDGERVGRRRVIEAATRRLREHPSPGAVLHALRSELLQEGVRMQDDVTMVVVQRQAAGLHTARVELPLRLSALRQVRAFVGVQSSAAGLDEADCGLLEVACVEAFTNIVRHGQGLLADAPVELLAHRQTDALVIELVHLGEPFQPPEALSETDFGAFPEGGFGLQIIQGASDGVEYLHHAGVNTLRMSKRLR